MEFNKPIDYYKLVIGVAVIIFIITMVFFWYFSNVKSQEFPPVMSNCPTNWKVNDDGTCQIPVDGVNMGNLNGKGRPIYKKDKKDNSGNQTTSYSTNPIKGGSQLIDLYKNKILAYTGRDSNTKFPNFPAGYDVTHPEKSVVDFTSSDWSEYGSTLCANHEWAIKNNINWEGVSNYNHC